MLGFVIGVWLVFLPVIIVRYSREHPCGNPGCSGTAWWRVFLILRAEKGERVDMLARMPTPYRVCGACYRDLDPATAYPSRTWRRRVAKALLLKHGGRVDWNRTKLEREHVLAAWLRRRGGTP